MVVSKKDTKRIPLSAVVEASDRSAYISSSKVGSCPSASFLAQAHPSQPQHQHQPQQPQSSASVNANSLEYIKNLRSKDVCETIVARKLDDGKVYTVKLVRKSGPETARLAHEAQLRKEQQVLRILTAVQVPYVTKLWWSFEDAKAMYIVMVCILLSSSL